MSDSRPRAVERFFSPPIARYRAWIWKSTVRVRVVLCLLLLVWLEMHKLQFNLSRIFKNIYEVTVFVINWAWRKILIPTIRITWESLHLEEDCTFPSGQLQLMSLLLQIFAWNLLYALLASVSAHLELQHYSLLTAKKYTRKRPMSSYPNLWNNRTIMGKLLTSDVFSRVKDKKMHI